jgi:hypothetical protein
MQGLFTSRRGAKPLGSCLFSRLRNGTTSFYPDAFSNLKIWLDASYGLYSDGAASFNPASTAYLSSTASSLATSGPTTWVGWFYIETTSTGARTLFGKYDSTASNREWLLRAIDSELSIIVSNDGGSISLSQSFGSVSTGAWFFVAIQYDGNRSFNVCINDSQFEFNLPGPVFQGTGAFKIGAFDVSSQLLEGRADSVAKWNRALLFDEVLAIYNNGNGLVYADLSTSQKVGLVSWWDLDETTGTRFDSHGTTDLTSNNVGSIAGIVAGAASHGDPVKRWISRNNLGSEVIQNTFSSKPIYQTATGYSVLFDGVGDILKGAFVCNQPSTVYLVAKPLGWTAGNYIMDGASLNSGAIYQSGTSPRVYAAAAVSGLTNNSFVVNQKAVITMILSGSGSVLDINGSGAVTGNLGTGNLGGLTLGASAASGNFSNVVVYEAIIFNSGHNAAARAQMRSYLGSKHAISVA